MGYRIPLRPISGMLMGFQGQALDLITLASDVSATRLDLTLNDTDSADVIVSITDGTTAIQGTILAGNTFVSVGVSAAWASGASITQTIVQGGTGMNFAGSIYVDAAAAPGTIGPGLITLAELKTALGLTSTTPEEDAYLQRQIDASSARIRNYLGHYLAPTQTYQDTWYKPNRAVLAKPYVQTITAIDDDGSDLDLTDLIWDGPSGRVYQPHASDARNWSGTNVLIIDYTAGFADTPIEVKEMMFTGIGQKFYDWKGSGQLGQAPGAIRKQVWADVGSIEYASSTQLSGYPTIFPPDSITGFPLSDLDDYRDFSQTNGAPNETRLWVPVQT